MNFLGIGKKVDPTEQAKEWKREIVRQQKTIERDIGKIKKEEQKAIAECKKLAKANQVGAARIIAKEIINTRKSIERMSVMKSQMHSVELQLQSSISIMKIQGCLSKSTEIMTAMNGLMRLPELNKALMGMAREMERAGLIEEVMDDTMSMLDPDGLEDAADTEVEKIISEALAGVLSSARAPSSAIKVSGKVEEVAEEEGDMDEMRSRLSALK